MGIGGMRMALVASDKSCDNQAQALAQSSEEQYAAHVRYSRSLVCSSVPLRSNICLKSWFVRMLLIWLILAVHHPQWTSI